MAAPASLNRLAPRLALAFGGIVTVALLATGLLAYTLVARAAEERLNRDMARAAEVISRFGPGLNDRLLHRLADLLGSEVVVVDATGEVVSGSLPPPLWPAVETAVTPHLRPAPGPRPPRLIDLPDGAYTALLHPLDGSPAAPRHWLTLLRPAAAETAWRRRIAWGLAAITLTALGLVSLVGHLLARRITRPVAALAAAATTVAAGGHPPPVAAPTGGEVAELASAFNTMVSRLAETERRRLVAERQAVAGRLAATVAHEVRNPLTSVQMLVQMVRDRLRREPGMATEAGYAEVVLREVARVELVVQDLLDLARPRPVQPRACDLEAVVAEVMALMEQQLTHQGITLSRATEGHPLPLVADPERLKQLLLNLLLNGAAAMAAGGRLSVMSRWPAGGGSVEVAVLDTGRGIDPAKVESLFEPFTGENPTTTGIGLAVSRQIARDHGGDLGLATAAGGGTVATLTLPLAPPAAPRHDGGDLPPPVPPPPTPRTLP
ncbi:MAG: HAMP domain-containing protein [Deltaproteobacteria bacterium]|nr:HAMP domain-containing protein [Deltaproteobacteria bacterium]NCP95446.1 HAMP domain-containing protein [Deltaproteobacteria bacterium]NCS72787.1 HAMP domain-containing protein [Deltaproteobacteria bacterium]OIP64535.1 MAG: hypothetical protein AUK30_06625 [Nitrospirae bacterium CG2_30_70_394]PIX83924.1 MAG: hypothetical protein COZ33_02910 [Nitrospirae bacterium CG_4_10_14_3_um_filter_70_108]